MVIWNIFYEINSS